MCIQQTVLVSGGLDICTIPDDEFYENYDPEPQVKPDWYALRQERLAQQEEAERAFFSHNWDSRWQWLHPIPQEHQSPFLVCCWCKAQATHFQKVPAHALFCSVSTSELRKMRRKQWLAHKRWKAGSHARMMQAACKR